MRTPAGWSSVARVGVRADNDLCRRCHEATGGNPFYVRELTSAPAAEGELSAGSARRVRQLGAAAVGRSVSGNRHGRSCAPDDVSSTGAYQAMNYPLATAPPSWYTTQVMNQPGGV